RVLFHMGTARNRGNPGTGRLSCPCHDERPVKSETCQAPDEPANTLRVALSLPIWVLRASVSFVLAGWRMSTDEGSVWLRIRNEFENRSLGSTQAGVETWTTLLAQGQDPNQPSDSM